jgi:hypothetical protein
MNRIASSAQLKDSRRSNSRRSNSRRSNSRSSFEGRRVPSTADINAEAAKKISRRVITDLVTMVACCEDECSLPASVTAAVSRMRDAFDTLQFIATDACAVVAEVVPGGVDSPTSKLLQLDGVDTYIAEGSAAPVDAAEAVATGIASLQEAVTMLRNDSAQASSLAAGVGRRGGGHRGVARRNAATTRVVARLLLQCEQRLESLRACGVSEGWTAPIVATEK